MTAPPFQPTTSTVTRLTIGTGHAIYTAHILPALLAARHSIILVTCFWAASPTLTALHATLHALNTSACARKTRLRIRIGLSSYHLPTQLLCHTPSPLGRIWTPAECRDRLGLPDLTLLPGLDVQVKSVFVRPLSVWHPKFVVVDGETALLPSCNVSWEDWLEGCVEMRGEVVRDVERFWREHWACGKEKTDGLLSADNGDGSGLTDSSLPPHDITTSPTTTPALLFSQALSLPAVISTLLPSPHTRNPNFRPFPWQSAAPPPPTPLNTHLLHLFSTARTHIQLQTPNLTSPPVLAALRAALARGVDVSISTCDNLMVLEQLVTAGTTTARCVQSLIHAYTSHRQQQQQKPSPATPSPTPTPRALEAQPPPLGRLRIAFYEPHPPTPPSRPSPPPQHSPEPVQAHFKLTIIDDATVVFGSGNMDRASWYTSQELGLALAGPEMVAVAHQALASVGLGQPESGRARVVFDSACL